MKFRTVAELVEIAESEGLSISEVMIRSEMEATGQPRERIVGKMEESLDVMEKAIRRGLEEEVRSHSGLTGGDARRIDQYRKSAKVLLSGSHVLDAVAKATATSEVNAAMGTIVATPTAGSCGILPGLCVCRGGSLGQQPGADGAGLVCRRGHRVCDRQQRIYLRSGGRLPGGSGIRDGNGRCGGGGDGWRNPSMSAEAVSIALKNMLGLVCDPVATLVEAPCVKRNAMGAAIAMVAADMALAGVRSVIPTDEVIEAMYRIGRDMPVALKETALGGLAATPTGLALERKIFGTPSKE